MSLHCPYEGCYRTFAKQQGLTQHIQNRHAFVECEQQEVEIVQDSSSEEYAKFFQDDKELFENLIQVISTDNYSIKVGF